MDLRFALTSRFLSPRPLSAFATAALAVALLVGLFLGFPRSDNTAQATGPGAPVLGFGMDPDDGAIGDMGVTLSKDETPGNGVGGPVDNDADTQIDEDPTVNGIDEDGDGADGEDPTGDIVASNVAQDIPVSTAVSLVGSSTGPTKPAITLTGISSAACDITWKSAHSGDIIQDIAAGPKKISKITLDPAFVNTLSGLLDSDTYTRMYEVTCPAGPGAPEDAALNQCNDTVDNDADTVVDDGCISFYSNITPGPGQPTDPEMLNDQAENHLSLIATNDVDGDADPNELDNCLWTANPNQTDTEGDGIGGACDTDDDDDGFRDTVEMHIGTNPLDNCPAGLGTGGDAWPLDNNANSVANVLDVLAYKGKTPGTVPPQPKRLDLDDNNTLNVSDVLKFKGKTPSACS